MERSGTTCNKNLQRCPNQAQDNVLATRQSEKAPAGGRSERGEMTMTCSALAPDRRTSSDPRRAIDVPLDVVSVTTAARGRATLRVLIANHQPIVRHGLLDVIAD